MNATKIMKKQTVSEVLYQNLLNFASEQWGNFNYGIISSKEYANLISEQGMLKQAKYFVTEARGEGQFTQEIDSFITEYAPFAPLTEDELVQVAVDASEEANRW